MSEQQPREPKRSNDRKWYDRVVSNTQETVERVRRLETRMTKFLIQQGFDTEVKTAAWGRGDAGVIYVPSKDISLRECLAVVPGTWPRTSLIEVRMHNRAEETVMRFYAE